MKKLVYALTKGLFLALLLLPLLVTVQAKAASVEDLTYTIENGEVTLQQCWAVSGDLVIPDAIEGYPVTKIADQCFISCRTLTSVVIPDSVTVLGRYAFYGCDALETVVIGNGVTDIQSDTFKSCESLTSVIVGKSVTNIGEMAFAEGTLEKLSIYFMGNAPAFGSSVFDSGVPDWDTSVSAYYFSDATGWTDSVMQDYGGSVTWIRRTRQGDLIYNLVGQDIWGQGPENPYVEITGYVGSSSDLVIPETIKNYPVTTICAYAFQGCSTLDTIHIPGSVTTIEYCAFQGCKNLETVVFKGEAPSINTIAFNAVTAYICCPENDPTWTEMVGNNYGGTLTWQHRSETLTSNGDVTCTEDGTMIGVCDYCGETFTAAEPALGHHYENGLCVNCGRAVVQPVMELEYPTLTFEDVVTMNVYYSASQLEDVVEMGLITYSAEVADWNVDNAEVVIPGYVYNEGTALYITTTQGIAAKDMGNTYWFAAYAKLVDGSYVYTRLVSYSPMDYAQSQLETADQSVRQLLVAMLNYGAAAQTYFGVTPDELMNADLTEAQQASIESYRPDMITAVTAPSEEKAANFAKTEGFTSRYPSITFEGAFRINYYCIPANTPVGDVTMYYWLQEDFDAAQVLSADNATGAIAMTLEADRYAAAVEGIAAKDLDKGVYVAFVYSDGANTYCSGILGYSIGAYCADQIAANTDFTPFAEATAVYGYYAKQLFGA